VRRINAMGEALGGAAHAVPVAAEELLARARESLGADDFGDFGDGDWRKAFTRIAEGLDAARLHTLGRLMTREELLRSLRTRLLLARARAQAPAIARERVVAPVIVTGPARSGTTILFELLALDPALRAPAAWEAIHPLPLPDARGGDRRRALAECEQELWADVQPEFAAIHELRSDLPVECVTLTAPCFSGPHWTMCLQIPELVIDVEAHYAFHRALLQTLQHGREPRTWLLKTPGHLYTLPQLFAAYPDAWVVQTHRDPVRTMPSTVSTTAMVQWLRSDHVDLARLAAAIDAVFGAALLGVIAQRASGAVPARFVDVHYTQLVADPVAAIRAAYEGMGREFRPEHAERIRAYLRQKPKGKFGVHRYGAEEWGFDPAALRERLAPYIAHYGIELE
jgi:hypothetical protein